MKLSQLRRLRLIPLLLLVSAVSLGGVAGASLPPQASDQGVAHAHTHGPDSLALDARAPGADPSSVDAHAAWNTCDYDRTALQTDAADLNTLPKVHAIYVYPAKTASRFLSFAAMFQADARQSSNLLNTLGRDVRWDFRPRVSQTQNPPYCGKTEVLDITVFQSKYNAKQLAATNQFTLVSNELKASGKFNSLTKKYVAWLDAGSQYCGQGSLYQDTLRSANNASEINRTTGIVYRPYASNGALTGGFCRGRTLLHELGHNLGAVQRVAPNAFDGAHCDDDNNDTMCYSGQAPDQVTSQTPQFDYLKNDYWDPGATQKTTANPDGYPTASAEMLPWWTLNLSKYICPLGAGGILPDCSNLNTNPGYPYIAP
jgi:hypothetical protein